MTKHEGCALCGSMEQEYLTSVPLFARMHSVALCEKCLALPAAEIAARYRRLEETRKELMRKHREAVNER